MNKVTVGLMAMVRTVRHCPTGLTDGLDEARGDPSEWRRARAVARALMNLLWR